VVDGEVDKYKDGEFDEGRCWEVTSFMLRRFAYDGVRRFGSAE
jgi:hypothetical protein